MKRKFKALTIAAKADSGARDVSVDHDRYLAEFTYARKLAGPKATLPVSPRRFRTSRKSTQPLLIGPAESSACANCGTTRYPLKARGMCGRCYNANRHLDQINSWNLSNEQSLKGYPPGAMYRNPKKLALFQVGYRKEWQRHLNLLRLREEKLRGPIGGKDLEDQLGRIARQAGVKKNLFDGVAGPVGQCFGPEQRSRLSELLNRIEEGVPWRGINQFRALSEPYLD